MPKKYSREELLRLFNEKHNYKYDYSKFEFVKCRDKGEIICPVHGSFFKSPTQHLMYGCKKCSDNARKLITNSEDKILNKFIDAHGDTYDYSKFKYKNLKTKVEIVCRKHGSFWQTPADHIRGHGCQECGGVKVLNWVDVLEKFYKVHGNRFDYSESVYQGRRNKILIKCNSCNERFLQIPASHMNGRGCPSCKKHVTSYRREAYIKNCTEKYKGLTNLYLIKCEDQIEVFYKLGISVKDVNIRYSGKIPYSFSVLYQISLPAIIGWDMEKRLHSILKKYHYEPELKFGGSIKECFSHIPIEVLRFLKNLGKSEQLPLIA